MEKSKTKLRLYSQWKKRKQVPVLLFFFFLSFLLFSYNIILVGNLARKMLSGAFSLIKEGIFGRILLGIWRVYSERVHVQPKV